MACVLQIVFLNLTIKYYTQGFINWEANFRILLFPLWLFILMFSYHLCCFDLFFCCTSTLALGISSGLSPSPLLLSDEAYFMLKLFVRNSKLFPPKIKPMTYLLVSVLGLKKIQGHLIWGYILSGQKMKKSLESNLPLKIPYVEHKICVLSFI